MHKPEYNRSLVAVRLDQKAIRKLAAIAAFRNSSPYKEAKEILTAALDRRLQELVAESEAAEGEARQ